MLKLDEELKRQLHNDRTISFKYNLLDFNNNIIGSLEVLNGIITFNSDSEIKRSASFTLLEDDYKQVDWLNGRIQPVMILNDKHEFPLGVFLMNSPKRRIQNNNIYRDIECYDLSLILLEDKIENRLIIPQNSNYITAITQIINSANILNVSIQNSGLKLNTAREFEIGTSKLEIVNSLLKEINYTSIFVDEFGYFKSNLYVIPNFRDVEYEYRNDELSVIKKDTSVEELDLFSIPNIFIAVASNPETDEVMKAKYINNNANSPLSTISRRRNIVSYESLHDIPNQATLEEYIRREAYEKSNVYGKFMFSTILMPHHAFNDLLYIKHDKLDIEGKFLEMAWNMELKVGGSMQHTARRVIEI